MRSFFAAALRALKFLLLLLVGYFAQVCILPYFKVGGITPGLMFAVVAVVTVCYGRLRAFWAGSFYGILMETLLPSITYLSLVLYPVAAVFSAIPFSDKSDKRLEYERSLNKPARNMNPYLRTVLCAGMNCLIYEVVNVTYVYLGGTDLTADHIGRAVLDVVLTMMIAALVALPLRRFLGFKRQRGDKLKTPAPRVA